MEAIKWIAGIYVGIGMVEVGIAIVLSALSDGEIIGVDEDWVKRGLLYKAATIIAAMLLWPWQIILLIDGVIRIRRRCGKKPKDKKGS